MARSDLRQFGPGPYFLGFERKDEHWGTGFPFDVPAVAAADQLNLQRPVTLFAGENGTGKSTLIEAIAESMGFASQGGELDRAGEFPARPRPVLGGGFEPILSGTKPRNGYFLRAESFFNMPHSSTVAASTRPTCRSMGTCPSTSSRTASPSWHSPRTGFAVRGSTCWTSPRPRFLSAESSPCSP